MSGMSLLSAFSTITYNCMINSYTRENSQVMQYQREKKKAMILTGILSGYLSLIRADSACLLSALQDGDFWLTKAREVKQQQLDLSEI